MKLFKNDYFFILIIAIPVFIFSLLISPQSIRLDEAQTIWVAVKPINQMLEFISRDVHVPLYFLLINIWIKIWGIGFVSVRSLSFIFYIASILMLYKLCYEIIGKKEALTATLFYSLSPFVVWYSQEARMYTLFSFVTIVAHYYFLKFYKTEGKDYKFELLLSLIFGVYTHYFFIFFIMGQFLYLLYKRQTMVDGGDINVVLKKYFVIGFIAGCTLLPWGYFVYKNGTAASTQPLISPPTAFNLLQTYTFFIFGYQSPVVQGLLVALWPMLLILIFLLFALKKETALNYLGYLLITAFVPVIIIFIISFIKPIFLARYLIFSAPSIFILIAIMLVRLPQKMSRSLIVGLILLMTYLSVSQFFLNTNPAKEDYKKVVGDVNKRITPADILVVTAPFTVYPIEYYYQGNTIIKTIPEWSRLEKGSGGIPAYNEDATRKQIEELKKNYRNMYVIFSYDQGYEEKLKQFLDSNLERIDLISYSPQMQLRVYKLRYD